LNRLYKYFSYFWLLEFLKIKASKILGGGGGKGTWGKPGCELETPWVDPNDPNYDSDEQVFSQFD